jgi:hypothetical protein
MIQVPTEMVESKSGRSVDDVLKLIFFLVPEDARDSPA